MISLSSRGDVPYSPPHLGVFSSLRRGVARIGILAGVVIRALGCLFSRSQSGSAPSLPLRAPIVKEDSAKQAERLPPMEEKSPPCSIAKEFFDPTLPTPQNEEPIFKAFGQPRPSIVEDLLSRHMAGAVSVEAPLGIRPDLSDLNFDNLLKRFS